jgi:RNA recognition motif-containing protein
MSKKLFVGGLSWNTTEETLRSAFESCGPLVEVKVITDRETGRSRGFGFVTFESPEDATNAISSLDGTELDGRNVRVSEANESPGGGRGGGGPRGGGGRGRDRGDRY